ncbi:MAG: cytochrome c1 [Gammaproteobacteria bacterium]|jgi:ubiquinol-cytochrome c reductase cytochrome c1 subunit|nr:cytochrome C [Chromatiales bacterium]MDP6674016.1 cytochrome c1 [Gammaproteobacteria bacterium]
MKLLYLTITLTLLSTALLAAESPVELLSANTDIQDKASLRRGAYLFINQCTSCHSAKYMRYARLARDLEISEEEVVDNMLRFGATKISDTISSAMTPDAGEKAYGIAPPDLTLEAKYRGVDWVYSYLMGFYKDEKTTFGYNNRVMNNVAMPWILASSQESMSEEEFSRDMRDLTNFMDYMAEPIKPWRQNFGKYVIIFLLVLLIPVWLLKREYWRDIHGLRSPTSV